MKHFCIERATTEKMINELSPEHQDIFRQLLAETYKNIPINIISSFIEQFESNCALDLLIASAVSDVIIRIGNQFLAKIEFLEENAKENIGVIATNIAIEQLRLVADNIEASLNDKH